MQQPSQPGGSDPAHAPGFWRARVLHLRGGLRIAAYERGPREAPPVLLVHGLGHWTAAAWDGLAGELEARHRLIAFDLPGFGESDKPDAAYDVAFFVDALTQVVAAFELERFALVGHSLGGLIAAEFAGREPERVTALALIDPAGFLRSRRLILLMLASAPASRMLRLRPSERVVRRILRRAVYRPEQLDPRVCDRACAFARDPGFLRAFARVYASGFAQLARMRRLHAGFARYRGPVALLWGRHDRYISIRALEHASRVYPQARASIFESSAHLPAVEEPAAVAAALEPILRHP